LDIQEHGDGVAFKIKVQPRASRNRVAGKMGDMLKVALTAPPVDGAANSACAGFLADLLNVPKNRVSIVSGHTGRVKLIKIQGMNRQELMNILEKLT